jgi:hypothetical protein
MGAWVLCIAFIGYACRMYICALNLFLHIQLYFGIMSKTFLSMAVFISSPIKLLPIQVVCQKLWIAVSFLPS